MDRREAVKKVTFLVGGAITASTLCAFSEGFIPIEGDRTNKLFTDSQEARVTEIADTIIPDSGGIPGAKGAGVGPFIVMMINDCYPEDVQKIFIDGLEKVEKMSQSMFNKAFVAILRNEREKILDDLGKELHAYNEKNTQEAKKNALPHFFQLVRELTLLGYYTSETGATQALEYVHVPGRYDSCVPLKEGQKAWAT
jgi:hypothetical protein